MFSYVSPEQRVPADHPLRAIRALTDEALRSLTRRFAGLYAKTGRPSIPPPGSTVAGDKGYDVASFVHDVRALDITPHVAEKTRYSAIDGRTTRHAGYQVSQRKRKLVEQVFGWMKTVGGLRKLRHRGGALVDWVVTFAAAAYNLVRLRTLEARCP
jgi:hypothetical protein